MNGPIFRKQVLSSAVALALVSLAGCSGHVAMKKQVDDQVADWSPKVQTAARSITPTGENVKPALLVRQQGAWLGAKPVALSPEASLPSAFNKKVTMIFPGRVNISTVAERITSVTGVPVRVKPDVFIPATSLQPRSASTTQAGGMQQPMQQGGPGLPALPAAGPYSAMSGIGAIAPSNYAADMEVNYVGPLAGFLDLVGARFGINWEYRDGAVNLFRLVTKTFTVKAHPGKSEFTTAIGKNGGTSTGVTGGSTGGSANTSTFSSNMAINTEAKFSVWDNLESAINTMLTTVGKVAVSQSTGTITVTDTKEVVDQVASLVDEQNAIMSKQVSIKVEIWSVDLNDQDQFGVDWSLVYSKLSNLNPLWTVNTLSPGTVLGAAAGSIGASIVTSPTSDSSTLSRLSGSKALFSALNEVSRAHVETTNSVITANRQPVPVAITNQVTYLASTTPATGGSTAAGTGVPGLTPGTVTTGYLMNLLPTLDGDRVMLQLSLDVTTLDGMGKESTGSGATLQSIQTPEISGNQTQQRVNLRAGETLVITGFERSAGQYDRRTLDRNVGVGLGGSISGGVKRQSIVILITPAILGG